MHQALRQAIRDVILSTSTCSTDHLGFIQGMPMDPLVKLVLEYDAYCKKHGLKRIRLPH